MQQHSVGVLSSLLFAPLLLCQGFAVCIAPFEKGLSTIVETEMTSKKYIDLIADLNSCRTAAVPTTLPDPLLEDFQEMDILPGSQQYQYKEDIKETIPEGSGQLNEAGKRWDSQSS